MLLQVPLWQLKDDLVCLAEEADANMHKEKKKWFLVFAMESTTWTPLMSDEISLKKLREA